MLMMVNEPCVHYPRGVEVKSGKGCKSEVRLHTGLSFSL